MAYQLQTGQMCFPEVFLISIRSFPVKGVYMSSVGHVQLAVT